MTSPKTAGPATDAVSHGVGFRAVLPIRWRPIEEVAVSPEQTEQDNLAVVRHLLAIENAQAEMVAGEQEWLGEIRRLNIKVDFLLGLVTSLLAREDPQPPARPVRVSAEGIEWQDAGPPEAGAEVEISVYLNDRFPRPLRLRADVECLVRAGDEWVVSAKWHGTRGGFSEIFERLIFQHHRREIAHGVTPAAAWPQLS